MSDYPFFFTWTSQRAARPLEIVGGDGAWFTTADGGRWLDLASFYQHAGRSKDMQQAIERALASDKKRSAVFQRGRLTCDPMFGR